MAEALHAGGLCRAFLAEIFLGAALFARTAGACTIGALISLEYRIGLGGIVYYIYNEEPPKLYW